MYVTIFDRFIPRWNQLQVHTRALIVGVSIIAFTILLGSLAVLTHFHFSALIALGVFYGIVLSKLMSQFLAPKIQSLVAGFLSGITAGNIGIQQARLSAFIHNIADAIQRVAQSIAINTLHADTDFNTAIVWGIWVAVLTAIVILAANAYYANMDSSPIGAATPPVTATIPVASAAGAAVGSRKQDIKTARPRPGGNCQNSFGVAFQPPGKAYLMQQI